MTEIVRTRFAPSPSGHLHVGGARTALFCWAYARSREGRFILRIEDTDQKRSSDAASMAFLEDLAWLGIDWDEGPEFQGRGGGKAGPYSQSERLAIYDEQIARLIADGSAYRAFETPEELDEQRRIARERKETYRYDRASRDLDDAAITRYLEEGKPHVVRLYVADDTVIEVRDEILGELRVTAADIDDFVIRKADGYPTYHFAVVVDDELMGVTHVLRAQEHLNNTPKHVALQRALGYRTPVYAHIPIISNADGSKMSKRDKDKALRVVVRERGIVSPPDGTVDPVRFVWWMSDKKNQLELEEAVALAEAFGVDLPEINVDDFRRAGYLPEVLINYLSLLGWNPGGDVERFDRDFLVKQFSLERVGKSAARFDRDKLLAFNYDTIQAMDPDAFVTLFQEHCREFHPIFIDKLGDRFNLFARTNQVRAKTLEEPIRTSRFFVMDDEKIEFEESTNVRKALDSGEPNGRAHLAALRSILEGIEDWSVESIEAVVKAYADEHAEGKLGKVAQPLRIAASGTTISPAIFDTLAILEKASVLRRIDRCLEKQ